MNDSRKAATVIEYSDFGCPDCILEHMRQLQTRAENGACEIVSIVARNFGHLARMLEEFNFQIEKYESDLKLRVFWPSDALG